MKLLIVDDEELTRTGVITSLDWVSLGIDEVLQADDGVHGLETARLCKPEIILCDVRMPRMDGISMLERLEKILPDTVPIFMSGYSDKEYLKAAIKLKAVNYIEKPFSISEIETAIREARELYTQKVHSRRGETLHSMETADKTGTIVLTGWMEDSDIVLLISDDGIGIAAEQLATILSGEGASSSGGTNIAVYNTHRRLQILYGPDYGLSYTSNPGHGTEVEIRIPARKHSATLDSIPPLYGK